MHAPQSLLQHFLQQQDMEATSMSNREVDKEDVVYIYNGILPDHKNE